MPRHTVTNQVPTPSSLPSPSSLTPSVHGRDENRQVSAGRRPRCAWRMTVGLVVLISTFAGTFAQLPELDEDQGLSGYGLALRKLSTVGSVLCITAHPDDEDNALMAKLSRGDGFRVGLLSLTRGDGGQNEIGPELFEALGVLRSEELAAVHRFDDVQQFYSRAFEFGFSYSVEETFEKWGREETLGDVVRVIREFRPTVILALNPEGAGGGQHHQASARLAAEAFFAAAEADRFPDQIASGLRPWQALRLFHGTRVGMGSGSAGGAQVMISLGDFDPLIGETWAEFGARARSNHRSQGMNILPQPTAYASGWSLAGNYSETIPTTDFFQGVAHGLRALETWDASLASSLTLLESYVDWAQDSLDRGDTSGSVKAVMTGLGLVRQLRDHTTSEEARFLLDLKEKDFLKAAEKGHFFHFDALTLGSSDAVVTPGESLQVRLRFVNRSTIPVELQSLDLLTPQGWLLEPLRPGSTSDFKVTVPATAEYSGPFWHRPDPARDRFEVRPGYNGTEAYAPPILMGLAKYRSFGVDAEMTVPVRFRWFDAAYGLERRREVEVAPEFTVSLYPSTSVVRVGEPSPARFKVTVRNRRIGPAEASVQLDLPPGWEAKPPEHSIDFQRENEIQSREFTVVPPPAPRMGEYRIGAVVRWGGQEFRTHVREIDYSHIQPRLFPEPAQSRLVVMDVKMPDRLRVGYVEGVGDEVAEATRQLAGELHLLSENDLVSGDLERFDVIVTGVRAYLVRPDLVANNRRLLEYVERGGHLLVQYNKYEYLEQQFAPYPVSISRPHDRVTVEESPVRILLPDHPAFLAPNRITQNDFDGWVQERGLYFLGEWDSRYQPLLELRDPWPYNPDPKLGGLVYADFGKGTFVYTGLAFFRQLQAGVPGAYRLWANLLSLGRTSKD